MQRSAWLFLFVGAFAAGVAFRSFYDFGMAFSVFVVGMGIILLASYLISARQVGSDPTISVVAAVVFIAAGLGILRFDAADLGKGSAALDAEVGNRVVLQGVIVDEPDIRESHTKLTLRVAHRNNDNNNGDTKILLIANQYPEFEYGNEVAVSGKLEKPKNFIDDDSLGRPFDYVSYLAKDGIYYQMFYPEIELVADDKGSPVKAFLFSLKQRLVGNTARLLPEPHNSLLAGILYGAKQSLGEELLEAFRATGIVHIVVLSGYNVTIVAENIARVFTIFPRFVGLGAGALTITAFAVMTGAGATVVRASLMALLVLLARATGRVRELTIALVAAGFAMILWNPKTLVFDPSFQLSFAATFGLIQIAPRIEKFFGWVPTRFGFREAATATIATQLFVLPLILYMMGTLSLVAPLTNVLILPTIPYAMFFGFVTSAFGFFDNAIATPFAWVSYALLEYELSVVQWFATLPFAQIMISSFPFAALVACYAVIGIVVWYFKQRPD